MTNNETYMKEKATFDEILSRLKAASNADFGVDPSNVSMPHLMALQYLNSELRKILNRIEG